MIEEPTFIRNRAFRTPLAAQWWRFFNYLGVRCPAMRSTDTGKWWSEVDFFLPTLNLCVLTARTDAEIDTNVFRKYGAVLLLGPIPDPDAEGEWCWQQEIGAHPRHVSFRGATLCADHDLGALPGSHPRTTPVLDAAQEPDLEVRRAYWVARTGAAKRTGSRKWFGGSPQAEAPNTVPPAAEEDDPPVKLSLTEPDPANFPATGLRVLVYLHYDTADVLVYVGISDQPIRRGKTHAGTSDWVPYAKRMEGRWCGSRQEAEAVEEYLIRTLRPVFNRRFNHGSEAEERRAAYLASKRQASTAA